MIAPLLILKVMLYQYFIKFFHVVFAMLTSLAGLIILAIGQVLALPGVDFGWKALLAVYLIDFITGVAASYKEWKEKKASGVQDAATASPYFFKSRSATHSLLKAITYILFIAMAWLMWKMFFDEGVQLPLSSHTVSIIQIAFGICIAIEGWSIIENMKRLGFDLIAKISNAFVGFWKAFRQIKGRW